MKLVTAKQMREIDRRTIMEIGIPGAVLMENAGRTTVQIIQSRYGSLYGKRVAVFVGKGNNGGDGFVVARYLHKEGSDVGIFLLSDADRVSGDAKINMDVCRHIGISIQEVTSEDALKTARDFLNDTDLIVDALLGTGLESNVRGLFADAITMTNECPAPVVAVDIPSGLDADRGLPLGVCVKADVTVTYGYAKIGQILYPGRTFVGQLHVVDISIPSLIEKTYHLDHIMIDQHELRIPSVRSPESHKGHHGHLLIVAGSPGKTGAAAMTAEAAARVGTGLVTLAVPKSLNHILENKVTEVMTEPLAETVDGVLAPDSFPVITGLLESKTALALGPEFLPLKGPSRGNM